MAKATQSHPQKCDIYAYGNIRGCGWKQGLASGHYSLVLFTISLSDSELTPRETIADVITGQKWVVNRGTIAQARSVGAEIAYKELFQQGENGALRVKGRL